LTAGLACSALVLAACSNGDAENDSTGTPTDVTTSAPTSSDETEEPTSEEPTEEPTDEPTSETPTEEPTSLEPSEEPSEDPTTEPAEDEESLTPDPDEFTTEESQSDDYPAISGQYLPDQVRVGAHDGFERIVVDYLPSEEGGTLEWHAAWVDEAIEDPSGFPLEIAGEKFLQITVSGIRYPTDEELTGDLAIELIGADASKLVHGFSATHAFEGMHQVVLGTEGVLPYRVTVLEDPDRLVIDLLTESDQ